MPASIRAEFVHAYAQSLSTVFLAAAPIAAVAFLLTWLLPEVRLRTTTQATDVGHTFSMPTARSSQEEIERALHVLASRDSKSLIYRRLADRAGMALEETFFHPGLSNGDFTCAYLTPLQMEY